jgi:RNA polymerase sigma factor (sigma-70 family)
MRNGQLDSVLGYIRRLAAAGQARELPDHDLLERFVACHDEAAFTAIVERYGRLVLGVCRRTLRSEHHAEDAWQATFLVLARKAASIRKRDSLGCWLYGVANRVARKLRADIRRRAAQDVTTAELPRPDTTGEITWREGLAVLDEELGRLPATYRSALVLCYLEGRTQDEAARELGCSLGALRGRLERARESLRTRLLRRGVVLPAALLGTTLLSTQTSEAVPPSLAIATVKAAATLGTGQAVASVVPAHVATLTHGVLKAMLMSKVQAFLALGIAASLLGIGAAVLPGIVRSEPQGPAGKETPAVPPGLLAQGRAGAGSERSLSRPGADVKGEEHIVHGTVRDAAGKPIAGARVSWVGGRQVESKLPDLAIPKGQQATPKPVVLVEATTDADGRAELRARYALGDYVAMLLIATAPGYGVAGKVFNDPKQPVAVTLRPEVQIRGTLLTPAGAAAKGVRVQLTTIQSEKGEGLNIGSPDAHFTFPYWPAATYTDDQGRFTLGGFSQDTNAQLTITHDDYAQEELYVSTKSEVSPGYKAFDIQPLKPEFTHTLQPARPVQGVVTAADTGKPLAGIVVEVTPMGPHGGQVFTTRTDAQGRYRVSGHAATGRTPNALYITTVSPPADSGYLCVSNWHDQGWPAGAKFLEKNFALPRGRLLHGSVIDADTKKPVAGASIVYQPKPGNPHNRDEYDLRNRVLTDKEGRFTITGLTGEGILVAEGPSADYLRVTLPRAETRSNQDLFPHGYVAVDVVEKEEPAPAEIKLRKGVTLEARVLGPDGKPVPWVYAGCRQLQACQIDRWGNSKRFDKGLFRMPGSDPKEIYRVFFVQPELHLGAVADLKYDGRPAEIRLQPTASVHGELVDPDGSPPRGYQAYALLLVAKDQGKATGRSWFFDQDRFLVYSNLTQRFGQNKQNPDGSFMVDDLIPGTPMYIVGATGRLAVRVPINLKPGENKDIGTLKLTKEEAP